MGMSGGGITRKIPDARVTGTRGMTQAAGNADIVVDNLVQLTPLDPRPSSSAEAVVLAHA